MEWGISLPRGGSFFPGTEEGGKSWLEEKTSGNVTCGEGEGSPAPRPPGPEFPPALSKGTEGSPSDWNHTSESLPLKTQCDG